MILKSLPLFLLLILLPDIYLYRVYVGRRGGAWTKVAWWAVCLLLLACTCLLAMTEDFTTQPQRPLNIFLFVLGVFTIPKAVFSLFDACGRWWSRRRRSRRSRRFGRVLGLLAAAFIAFATFYGSTAGFNKFEVRHIDYWSDELPAGFDGYRIALFSDAHVGSYQYDSAPVLEAAIDSLNAMGADAIFFLGDIQNTRPEEIERKLPVLSRLHAPDGVFSILGNHDYAHYIGGTREEKMASEAKTMALERQMGWRLLLNEHTLLRHGGDSIVLAGMEGNDGLGEDHGQPIWEKTVEGIDPQLFSIMLLHNPQFWQKYVVDYTDVPLTLSGHTHGGQVALFGFSPTKIMYSEDDGEYDIGRQHLFVTRGLGGLIPLRFNVTGEVVLLTLHKKPH